MSNPTDFETYLGEQMALFEGGYQQVTVCITVHLSGAADTVVAGVEVYDTATREPIALQVPTVLGSTARVHHVAAQLGAQLEAVRRLLATF